MNDNQSGEASLSEPISDQDAEAVLFALADPPPVPFVDHGADALAYAWSAFHPDPPEPLRFVEECQPVTRAHVALLIERMRRRGLARMVTPLVFPPDTFTSVPRSDS